MYTTELGEASLLTTVGSVFQRLLEGFSGLFLPSPILSPEVNLLSPGIVALFPAKPGYYLLGASLRPVITAQAGPAVATPPTIRIGNNPGRTNVLASTVAPTMGQLNAGLALPYTVPAVSPQGTARLLDLAAPVEVEVTGPAVGPSVLRVRFIVIGAFLKVGDL